MARSTIFKSTTALILTAILISCAPKSRDGGIVPTKPTESKTQPVQPEPENPIVPPVEHTMCDRMKQDNGFIMPDFNIHVDHNEIKIMAYNAENLFDTRHDSKHEDWTYLPKDSHHKSKCKEISNPYYQEQCFDLDWNTNILSVKIEQLARVVESQGEIPDLLGLEEVENKRVVRMLGKRLGYKKLVVTKGSDKRGINNALLYSEKKLKYRGSREVVVGGDLNKHTRNILGVYFRSKLNKSEFIGVYVNHWPSQGNPSTDRVLAAQTLKSMIEEDRKKYGPQFHPIAIGDFNTLAKDNPHPFNTVILNKNEWANHLVNVEDAFNSLEVEKGTPFCDLIQNMPHGTYYYKKNVQTLDYFLVGQNLFDGKGMELQLDSFRILAAEVASDLVTQEAIAADGTKVLRHILVPKGLEGGATAPGHVGASDHFPIVVKLKLN